MPWTAAAIVGSAVIGSKSSSKNRRAAQQQEAANRAAEAAERARIDAQQAPFRARLAELETTEGFNKFIDSDEVRIPVQRGTDILSRSLSVTGNPMGGNQLTEIQDYATKGLSGLYKTEQNRLAQLGGLGQGPRQITPTNFFENKTGEQVTGAIGLGLSAYNQQQNRNAFGNAGRGGSFGDYS